MAHHYVAIVEDPGPDQAVGVWFPDLPGCFSAGDDIDEALRNAAEALSAYADLLADEGRDLPPAAAAAEFVQQFTGACVRAYGATLHCEVGSAAVEVHDVWAQHQQHGPCGRHKALY